MSSSRLRRACFIRDGDHQDYSSTIFSRNFRRYIFGIGTNNFVTLLGLLVSLLYQLGVLEESILTCHLSTFIGYTGSFLCPWYICCLTIERFVVVRYPLRSRYLVTELRTFTALVLISVIAMAYNSWILVYMKIQTVPNSTISFCFMDIDDWSHMEMFLTLNLVFTFAIPLGLLCFLNAWMIAIIVQRNAKDSIASQNRPPQSRTRVTDVNVVRTKTCLVQPAPVTFVKQKLSVDYCPYRAHSKPETRLIQRCDSLELLRRGRASLDFDRIKKYRGRHSLIWLRQVSHRLSEEASKRFNVGVRNLLVITLLYILLNAPMYILRQLSQSGIAPNQTIIRLIYLIYITQFSLHSTSYSRLLTLKTNRDAAQSMDSNQIQGPKLSAAANMSANGHGKSSYQSNFKENVSNVNYNTGINRKITS